MLSSNKSIVLKEKMAIHVDISKFDEPILLINNSVNEKQKYFLLSKATEIYVRGRTTHVKELTRVAFSTLHSGNIETNNNDKTMSDGRVHREETNQKSFIEHQPDAIDVIEKMIHNKTYGDPFKVIHWILQSMKLQKIEAILMDKYEIPIDYVKISQLLTDIGYNK